MKRKRQFILLFCIVVTLIFLIFFYYNSYRGVLGRYELRDAKIIQIGIDANDNVFRVVCQTGDAPKAATITKMFPGYWKVTSIKNTVDSKTGIFSYTWVTSAGFNYFNTEKLDETHVNFLWEYHNLYYGSNAVKPIELVEYLPPNVTVHIQQANDTYLLHFITFGKEYALADIHIDEILKKSGCIQ